MLKSDYDIYNTSDSEFKYFSCLSRKGVSDFECTEKLNTLGEELYFVVDNQIGNSDEQPAPYELTVFAGQVKK